MIVVPIFRDLPIQLVIHLNARHWENPWDAAIFIQQTPSIDFLLLAQSLLAACRLGVLHRPRFLGRTALYVL